MRSWAAGLSSRTPMPPALAAAAAAFRLRRRAHRATRRAARPRVTCDRFTTCVYNANPAKRVGRVSLYLRAANRPITAYRNDRAQLRAGADQTAEVIARQTLGRGHVRRGISAYARDREFF